jgi:hypothetical protein
MSKRSKQLNIAYELRDQIANLVREYQRDYPGLRLLIVQECSQDVQPNSAHIGRAKIDTIAIDVVARDGTHKATAPLEI